MADHAARSHRAPTPHETDGTRHDVPEALTIDTRFEDHLPRDHLPQVDCPTPESRTSLSRARSFQNLPDSALAGIYTAADDDDIRDTDSPWDTGAERPVKRDPCMDDQLYMLLRDRCYPPARRRVYSISQHPAARRHPPAAAVARFLATRGVLLCALGVGYAMLITCFHKEQNPWAMTKGYLASWGALGVVLGGAQPLFDRVWQPAGPGAYESRADESKRVEEPPRPAPEMMRLGTHWESGMRAVGAVMGIVYAFRHLIWASTMQFSVALALVNPLLWWAVDRSRSGFVFSAIVAVAGSLLLLGTNLQLVPSPPTISAGVPGVATGGLDFYLTLGGRVSIEAAEEAIWMFSVLFCSSVGFGNVGRVLATEDADRVVPWDPMVKVEDI